MLYADSFVFKLISTLSGLEKEVCTLKCDLAACEKANTELQKAREAAEAREDATEGKLRLERQAREGMCRIAYSASPPGVCPAVDL